MKLQYDYTFMMDEFVEEHGISEADLLPVLDRVKSLRQQYFSDRTKLGFMQLPYQKETVTQVRALVSEVQEEFDTLIVLGIGGSDLGARACISALRSPFANWDSVVRGNSMRVFFLGGNTDPLEIEDVLKVVDLSRTAINVISKSGDTVETMSAFIYLQKRLIDAVGHERHSRHVIATTDHKKGTLRAIVDTEGYRSLVVPETVGGRFSVLSTVGLFPIACAGIPIEELLDGARAQCEEIFSLSTGDLHSTEVYAALHYLGYQLGKPIHILIPYSSRLKEIGFWYRQLWAESLGKKDSLSGEEIFVGPTPIAALGATDQHSQFQLYYYGPFDKLITFVEIEKHSSDIKVPGAYENIEGISYMKDIQFGNILNSELKASSLALAERGRPNGRILLPDLSSHSIGELLQFFEIATAYMGGLLNINTYDQPGVELGKQNMYALLHRKGFEDREKELLSLMKVYATKIV